MPTPQSIPTERLRPMYNSLATLTTYLEETHDPRPWALWASDWSAIVGMYAWSEGLGRVVTLWSADVLPDPELTSYADLLTLDADYDSVYVNIYRPDTHAILSTWEPKAGGERKPAGALSLALPAVRSCIVLSVDVADFEVDDAGAFEELATVRVWDISAGVELVDDGIASITLGTGPGGGDEVTLAGGVPAGLAAGDVLYAVADMLPFTLGGSTRHLRMSAGCLVTLDGTSLRLHAADGVSCGFQLPLFSPIYNLAATAFFEVDVADLTALAGAYYLAGLSGETAAKNALGGVTYTAGPVKRHGAAHGALTAPAAQALAYPNAWNGKIRTSLYCAANVTDMYVLGRCSNTVASCYSTSISYANMMGAGLTGFSFGLVNPVGSGQDLQLSFSEARMLV